MKESSIGLGAAAAAGKGPCRCEGRSCGMAVRQEHPLSDHTPPTSMAPHRAGHSAQRPRPPPHWWVSSSHPVSAAWKKAKEHPWAVSCSLLSHCSLWWVGLYLHTPKAQPQPQPCPCGCTNCPRGDKLWFHQTPPCFLTPLWHFISGETEALQYCKGSLPPHPAAAPLVPSPSKPTQLSQF